MPTDQRVSSVANKKIFLIEDDPDQIIMYRVELEKHGYKVLNTRDVNQALKIAKEEKPDLILLDLLLGNNSGMNVLKNLKKDPETKDFKVVILTNFKKKGLMEECLKEGAADYLLKDDYVPKDIVKKAASYL